MGVTTSNTDMFTVDTAMGMLVELRPKLTDGERIMWRNKGSDAIVAEVARIKASMKVVEPVEVKEEEDVPATSTVAKKGK